MIEKNLMYQIKSYIENRFTKKDDEKKEIIFKIRNYVNSPKRLLEEVYLSTSKVIDRINLCDGAFTSSYI